ncbi:hypothetical protein LDENG_00059220, partial [Lucifuga dentata]
KSYTERHNQVAGIVYRNICAKFRLEVPKSKWETPSKVTENNGRAKILWGFKFRTGKQVLLTNQTWWLTRSRRELVINAAILSDANIRKKEHKKL